MKKNSNIDIEEKEINLEDDNKNKKKKKFVIFLVVVFVLSLITSGLTTNFYGRIGTAFRNEGTFVLKHTDDNNKETIRNQELKFDSDLLKMSVSDTSGKLSYSRERVVLSDFTCETGDASIATCYPADGYVVIYPKSVGKTTVTLRGEANGKIYAATADVEVGEAERYIELASNEGTINLNTNKVKEVAYYLVGMSGDVKVTSSNESVAKATTKNGVLKITASKVGKADITVSVTYNDQTYTSVYKVNVVNEANKIDDNKPVSKKKSRISTLSKLTVSSGELEFNPGTTSYSIVVGKDVETIDIDFEKTNANAKVITTIDNIATLSLKNIPLRDGAKEVMITVISEDGTSTTTYKIAINRVDDEMLDSITSITVNGKKLSAMSPTYYTYKVASDVETVSLNLEFSDDVVSARYIVDNQVTTDGSFLKNLNLKLGKNTIQIVVRNKYGIHMICFVTIEREALSDDTSISLEVTDEDYVSNLVQVDDNNYVINDLPYEKNDISLNAVCTNPNCKKISFDITYADGTKKDLDDLNEVPLKEGMNKIAITVVAEDGKTTETHYVSIYKPIRTIVFEKDSNKVLVEKEYTKIPYSITEKDENGIVTTIELDNAEEVIKAALDKYSEDDVEIEVHQGFIKVTPKNPKKLVGNKDTLKLVYGGKEYTTEVTFDIDNYDLSSGSKVFDMTNSKAGNTRTIILNTDLVKSTDDTLSIERSDDGKRLTICDKDKIYCVNVEVDTKNDDGNITLSYGKDSVNEIGPNDLPITITAKGDGDSTIKVSGSVYGKSINKDFDIVIKVSRKYLITIHADDPDKYGKFNSASTEWVDEISKDEKLDLSLIPEPYKVKNCKYYKFKHYTVDKDSKDFAYDRDANKYIDGSTLKDDLDVYAIYEINPSDEKIPETNSLWLKASDYAEGLPLFHNDEYYAKHNEDKVIYPGATGSYVMNFTAEDDMKLTGMVLKEKNICVEGKCLNMGYMIHYNEIRRTDGTYEEPKKDFFGVKGNSEYWILNKKYDIIHSEVTYLDSTQTKQTLDTDNRTDIKFDEEIELHEGDQISMTIFWKWVEEDDTADTMIGEYAAQNNNSINDKYGLSVGLIYQPMDVCPE